MNLFWPLILSLIAGLSTMLGTIPIFIPIKNKDRFIAFSISLSLSIMIMVSILDLIPEALKHMNSRGVGNFILLIMFFILGIVCILIINMIIDKEIKRTDNLYKIGILNFIALMLHNIPEGILTFIGTSYDFKLGLSLCIAISLHNIPEGIAIAIPIYYSTKSKLKAIKSVLLSSLSEPFGALIAYIFLKDIITNQMIGLFLIMVAGIMITLAIEKLLPEASSYNYKKEMYLGFILGVIIIIFSLYIG